MAPIVGLTAQPRTAKSPAGEFESHALAHTYTDCVLRAGGLPILLPPVPPGDVDKVLDLIDGLILTGGGDIDPQRYGETAQETVLEVDFDRDEFELELVHRAKELHLPVLAICRGIQVVNVAFGGSLIQDIATETGSMDHDQIGHLVWNGVQPVKIEPDCRLSRIVGDTELMVNSIHHQAIRDVAPGLRAVAWAGDGVVEAIEHDDERWPLIAVQWHPEFLGQRDDAASFALFSAFVESARVTASER